MMAACRMRCLRRPTPPWPLGQIPTLHTIAYKFPNIKHLEMASFSCEATGLVILPLVEDRRVGLLPRL